MTPDLEKTIRIWANESEGWTTAENCLEMAELILTEKPAVVLEIGVFGGRSFIPQALALKANGHGQIYGIDPWKREPTLEGEIPANAEWWAKVDLLQIQGLAAKAIWSHQVDEFAVLIQSQSQHCLPLFSKVLVDILTIDGNHSEVASCRDVRNYLPRVKIGGHIWMDDIDWASTRKAQELIETCCDKVKETTASNGGRRALYIKRRLGNFK